LEHVKALWAELAKTSKVLVHKIRTEARVYLACVDAATNVTEDVERLTEGTIAWTRFNARGPMTSQPAEMTGPLN
jgi:hypothetical protein